MPTNERLLFRRAGMCLEPLKPTIQGGLNAKEMLDGAISSHAERVSSGPGMIVDIGWSNRFDDKITWQAAQSTASFRASPIIAACLKRR